MRSKSIYGILIWTQGLYFAATALWGLLDIGSFMQVTGPKMDIWLVKTVSVLLIPLVIFLFSSLYYGSHRMPVMLTASTAAAGLAVIDFYYTSRGTIKWVYVVDGFIEMAFFLLWLFWLIRQKRRDRYL